MALRRLSLVLAASAVLVAACTGAGHHPAEHPAAAAPTASASGVGSAGGNCSSPPPVSPLPTWARGGFIPPDVAMPHVLGARGDIIAILWVPKNALWAPPLPHQANKILWVSKVPIQLMSPLRIRATLPTTGQTVTRQVTGGPGPSIIDLPSAGCWTLDLSWSGHTDLVRLRYAAAHRPSDRVAMTR